MSTTPPEWGTIHGTYKQPTAFGTILRQCRDRRCLSQSALARLAGINHTIISRYESGDRNPTRDTVTAIADALDAIDAERDDLLIAAGFLPDGHRELLVAWSLVPVHLRGRIMAVIEAVADDDERSAAA